MRALPTLALAVLLTVGCTSRPVYQPIESAYVDVVLPADDAEFARWLASERAGIEGVRQIVLGEYGGAEMTCWQRFAVNDCLRNARRERRARLDILRGKELELNALERDHRTVRRLQRLESKAVEEVRN